MSGQFLHLHRCHVSAVPWASAASAWQISQRSQSEAFDLLFANRASAAIFCRASSDLASKGAQFLHRSNFSTGTALELKNHWTLKALHHTLSCRVSLVPAEIFQILALLYKLVVACFYATIPKTVAHLSFSHFTLDSSKARATELRKTSRIYENEPPLWIQWLGSQAGSSSAQCWKIMS